jgi:hypothetical protein
MSKSLDKNATTIRRDSKVCLKSPDKDWVLVTTDIAILVVYIPSHWQVFAEHQHNIFFTEDPNHSAFLIS